MMKHHCGHWVAVFGSAFVVACSSSDGDSGSASGGASAASGGSASGGATGTTDAGGTSNGTASGIGGALTGGVSSGPGTGAGGSGQVSTGGNGTGLPSATGGSPPTGGTSGTVAGTGGRTGAIVTTGGNGPSTGSTGGSSGLGTTGGRSGINPTGGRSGINATGGRTGNGGIGGRNGNSGGSSSTDPITGGTNNGGNDQELGGTGTAGGGPESGGTSATAGGGNDVPSGTSPGCGTASPLVSGTYTIDVDGTEREYILDVPTPYDANNPYILIFTLHWMGGSMTDVSTTTVGLGAYYGLKSLSQGTAVFVSPQGLSSNGTAGWPNTGGQDMALIRALLDHFQNNLCIDTARIFSTGFSYGGMMSDAIGCEMSDVFRAIAPMSDALYSGCKETSDRPIAVWMAHGTSDTVVPLEDGKAALAVFVEKNHCTEQTAPTEPSPCVAYEGCDDGYPVHWCEFDGGHSPQSFAPQAVWNFFSQF